MTVPLAADPDSIVSAAVRAIVAAQRIDTAELADALHISRNSYYNRINGDAPWLLRDVVRLADFLGCSVDSLTSGHVVLAVAS